MPSKPAPTTASNGRKHGKKYFTVAEANRAVAYIGRIMADVCTRYREAVALRELGRIERTLFILDWLQNVELRRRVHAGLNKGEARNALARAVFFNRLGEIRDRSFEQQRYRASGLNLATAAIVLWNTVYLERAVNALRKRRSDLDETLLEYLSPLGWEHINLTGDYLWRSSAKIGAGKFRPLRPLQPA